jgi:hypothetical protein
MPDYDGTLRLDSNRFVYSSPGGPNQCNPYPHYVYHATEPPRVVRSDEERRALSAEWSDTYIKKDYPKMLYKAGSPPQVVNNPEEEGQLSGYSSTPPPEPEPRFKPGDRTLQEVGEAARDGRRLSLDYVQLNQDLDTKADNVAMRPISPQDLPHPHYRYSETPEEIKKREAELEAKRKEKEENGEKVPGKGSKGR